MKTLSGIIGSGTQGNSRLLIVVAVGLLLLITACGRGSYPIELFSEMHYTQSYKAGEPDRLAPPSESVPWVGMGFAAVQKAVELAIFLLRAFPGNLRTEMMERWARAGRLLFQALLSRLFAISGQFLPPQLQTSGFLVLTIRTSGFVWLEGLGHYLTR